MNLNAKQVRDYMYELNAQQGIYHVSYYMLHSTTHFSGSRRVLKHVF